MRLFLFLALLVPNIGNAKGISDQEYDGAETPDTTTLHSEHFIALNFLGNSYLPPFHRFGELRGYGMSSFNFGYAFQFESGRSCWQLSTGLGLFQAEWYDTQNEQYQRPYVEHHTWGLIWPVGVLWHLDFKERGLWAGAFFTSAFGTQQYSYNPTASTLVVKTLNYDCQLMPNLAYIIYPKGMNGFFSFYYSPKFVLSSPTVTQNYNWKVLPLYGGITAGLRVHRSKD